jgi:hypothetical protein
MIPNPKITNWKRERKEWEALTAWVDALSVKHAKIAQA